jgi:hypothetical protein
MENKPCLRGKGEYQAVVVIWRGKYDKGNKKKRKNVK